MGRPTTQLDPALRDFLAQLEAAKSRSRPSIFWQQQLESRLAYKAGSDEDVGALAERVSRGYGFEDLPSEVATPSEDPGYVAALDGVKRPRKAAARLDKGTYEHEFIAPLRVRSTMSVARHWYYARQVDRWAQEVHGDRALDVLEIGAGAGNLGVFLAHMGRVGSYTTVDLPQMLVHSAFTVWRQIEVAQLRFETAPSAGTWTFISDGLADELLTERSFDLCQNFNSFMEMDRKARDDYFALIYRTARPGALFVNVNRRQPALPLPDGSTWDSNPLLYPYRTGERILAWEEDRFQTVTRAGPRRASRPPRPVRQSSAGPTVSGRWRGRIGAPIKLTVTRASVIHGS
jgi:predicted O-methyltransferase YrrM